MMAGMLTPPRIHEEELLDAGVGTDEDVARNLKDLRRVNRWLGGTRVILDALRDQITDGTSQLSLLDVGTGSADIPMAVAECCSRLGVQATVVGADISERNIRVTRARLGVSSAISMVQADALALPFKERSFDYVTASMFLHHFREEDVIRLLASFGRIARRAVIVNDLIRNLIPYYFTKITGPLFASSFLTRNDAPVSVLSGFTVREMVNLVAEADLKDVRVRTMFPYRLVMVASPAR
jgi:2-polyprenyl-3-methyl-5-hydroxy-6-metoxy-1,4-benzoquinol methylase